MQGYQESGNDNKQMDVWMQPRKVHHRTLEKQAFMHKQPKSYEIVNPMFSAHLWPAPGN